MKLKDLTLTNEKQMINEIEKLDSKLLSKKILYLFLAASSILIIQSIYNIFTLGEVDGSIKTVHSSTEKLESLTREVSTPISRLRMLSMELVMAPNVKSQTILLNHMNRIEVKIDKTVLLWLKELEENMQTKQVQEKNEFVLFEKIIKKWNDYKKAISKTKYYVRKEIRVASFISVTKQESEIYNKLIMSIEKFNKKQLELSQIVYNEAESTAAYAYTVMIMTTVIEVIILKLIMFFVLRLVKTYSKNKEIYEDHLELQITQNEMMQTKINAQEKLASLGTLTTGIAHEINKPINLINSSALSIQDLFLKKLAILGKDLSENNKNIFNTLSTDSNKLLNIITENGKRASLIINNMILQTQSKESKIERINLKQHLRTYIEKYNDSSVKLIKDLNLQQDIDLSDHGDINIYPKELGRAILNIVDNSLFSMKEKFDSLGKEKYSPRLKITTRDFDHKFIEIYIYDNGNGIDETLIDKVFDPFFTTKGTGNGSGLGLSIAYDLIVILHSGKITINSESGDFTEVVILIPA
ncbi:hypothetical protein A9Q84_17455 [Halobacteriovorax marinus]|uniref:histidine kinase n=1 Tax=Halobacteriovorax marinus TaxID=97084 RepID=A0A1Y5F8I2_9BACT|nr:hypothetical protein A9Q84_17455 [Halobacteriovorax marinus]